VSGGARGEEEGIAEDAGEDELAVLRRNEERLRAELREARSLVVQSQRELERARGVLAEARANAALLRAHIATICC
jgi:hypothetical protein